MSTKNTNTQKHRTGKEKEDKNHRPGPNEEHQGPSMTTPELGLVVASDQKAWNLPMEQTD